MTIVAIALFVLMILIVFFGKPFFYWMISRRSAINYSDMTPEQKRQYGFLKSDDPNFRGLRGK